jgi:DNA-binding PadR family transcriptional regulator
MSVKYALLALLYQREMYGYELGKQLALTLKTDWDVKAGQIASTLQRLEQAGLVDFQREAAEAAPDRKVYHLTEAGVEALREWYLTAELRDYRMGDSFYLKLVFSLIGAPVSPEQVLGNQRRRLYQELHDVMQIRNDVEELPLVLMLETVIMHIEADIRWLEMCESRLSELKQYQPPKPQPQPRGRPKHHEGGSS